MELYLGLLSFLVFAALLELVLRNRIQLRMYTVVSKPEISFSPFAVNSMDSIVVSWSGVSEKELDRKVTEYICDHADKCLEKNLSVWIGVFPFDPSSRRTPKNTGPMPNPANPPWVSPSPIKWKPVTKPSGHLRFNLHHHRSELYFVLFTNGTSYPVPLSVSQKNLKFRDIENPHHFHVAQGVKENSMVLMFEARSLHPKMEVKWGYASNNLNNSIIAEVGTFHRRDFKGSPASTSGFVRIPYFYRAEIRNLIPSSRIFYYVSAPNLSPSRVNSFRSPKKIGPSEDLRIIALADLGVTYLDGSQYHWSEPYAQKSIDGAISALKRHGAFMQDNMRFADVALLIGDLSYATGYQSKWDYFMTRIEPLASKVPFMIGQGNHERDCPNSGSFYNGNDSGGECGISTQMRFHMPTSSQEDGWYSFAQGPVHFVMMNTEKDASFGTRQYEFLDQDMSSVDRVKTPWIIFCAHRPMYSSPYTNGSINPRAIWWKDIEDLLIKHKVKLALYGHVHNAEVTCPMYRGRCVKNNDSAPVHAVIGNAGQTLSPFNTPIPAWSKWRYENFGFSTIEASSNKLVMSFFSDIGRDFKTPIYHFELKV